MAEFLTTSDVEEPKLLLVLVLPALTKASALASSVVMPLVFGAAGAVAGVSAVFWVIGAGVGSASPLAWRLRPRKSH